jgi:hypothetical protein
MQEVGHFKIMHDPAEQLRICSLTWQHYAAASEESPLNKQLTLRASVLAC